jgi:isoquinoline 1-oxidoreductase beta subunit
MSGYEFGPERFARRFGSGGVAGEVGRRGERRTSSVTRRDFVKIGAAAGGGLLLAIHLPGVARATEAGSAAAKLAADGSFEPGAFVRIDPDSTATITVAKSEMGQGVRTTLALMVAEELDLDWDTVKVEQAPANEAKYGRQGTGGSASVRSNWIVLREAGARARAMLVAAAAAQLGVAATELETREGRVFHRASGRGLSYGELASAAAAQPVPEEVRLKPREEWRLLGKHHAGVDVKDIITGRAKYGLDTRREGMLYAAVARTPAHGGTVRSYDVSRALAVAGVQKVVEVPAVGNGVNVHAGIAVIAENTWAALRGRDALRIDWDRGPHGDDSSEMYARKMRESVSRPGGATVNRLGDPDAAIAGSDAVVAATFEVPFISHATMEPQNCTAEVDGQTCRLHAPSQFPNWAAQATAQALGIPQENIELTIPLLGGGFGRRINPDVAVEAALIARQVEGPVKVVWTREDDVRHDFYRPAAVHRIEAVLGDDGYPVAWRHRFSTPAISGSYEDEINEEEFGVGESTGAGNMLYRVPNRSCEYTYLPSALTRGWWRAVSTTHTIFAVESFIDELAERAGIDPVDYRLALIDAPQVDRPSAPEDFPADPERLKGVLRLAAEKAGWGKPLPEGHGMGVACGIDHLSYAAEVIEVSVRDGELSIEKVVVAADCGPVLNPDIGRAQLEGGVIQGLSAALKEKLTLRRGAIEQGNFGDYPILRLSEAPKVIETYFVETDAHPTGLGEPAVPPAAPALANALCRATGRRFRTLPISL